jgi:hypothetical protein
MKKSFSILMMIVAAVLVVSSCGNGQRTLAEMQKDERKAIRKLMDSLDIKVLKEYPENGVFAENEFFQLPSGLYINVIDSGNGNRAIEGQIILCRFEFDYINGRTGTYSTIDGFDNQEYPLMFALGSPSAYGNADFTGLYGGGMVEPLNLVGDSSYVKLIVPFKVGVGGQAQQQGGDPVYYKKFRYIFEK